MPGASKWPLEHTVGHQNLQKGALRVAFGAQNVEFGKFEAPKVLKMVPLGPLWGAKLVSWGLLGALFNQMLIW